MDDVKEMIKEAEELCENGNYRMAMQVCSEAIILCPRYDKSNLGVAYSTMAVCYKKLGDEEKFNEYAAKSFESFGDFYAGEAEKMSTSPDMYYKLQQKAEENYSKAKKFRGESCFVTTAVCDSFGKSDDCYELTTFRKFRDTWLKAQPDGKSLIAEYYSIAPRIVANINSLADSAQIYKTIWQKYLEPCLNFIRCGDNLACKNKYIEMIYELKKTYC